MNATRRALRLAAAGAAVLVGASGCSLPGTVTGPVKITAIFDDVGDLVVNHSVQVADVRVGSITDVELTSDFKAKVTMQIKRLPIPADTVAELRTTSLLGEKFINLRPCDPTKDGTDACTGGGTLQDGAVIPAARTKQAPELEFVAEQAVELLGGVAVNDLTTLIETGSVGFGGRAGELRGLVEDLSTISATLAQQTTNIAAILDGLDRAASTLANGSGALDQLLVTLPETVKLLAENRDQLIDSLRNLTRLAQDQNHIVFDKYLDTVNRQIKQVDAILDRVTAGRAEVGLLVDWLEKFVLAVPKGIPGDYAQVYGWFVLCGSTGNCAG